MISKKVTDNRKSNRKSGGQKELFKNIWETRGHFCEICLKNIPEPKTYCFAHILSKGRYPEYKFDPRNIALVCSLNCHATLDRRNAHKDYLIIQSWQSI